MSTSTPLKAYVAALLAASVLSGFATAPAFAQDTSSTTPDPTSAAVSPAGAVAVGDIVVTARKRKESLQKVPLTITALTSEMIAKTDTKTVYDLATRTPGLYYGTSGGRNGGNKLQIRNLSTGTSGGSKASVFIDGVFVAGDYSSTPLNNLERVEVLKGPQSAYFGRSTFVGAVNFVTRDPGDKFEGRIEVVAATQDETDVTAFVTTPIIGSTLSNTISGRIYDYHGPSAWTGPGGYHFGDQSTRAVTDKLVFRPTSDITIRWYNSYVHDRDHLPQTTYAPLSSRNLKVVRPDGTVAYYFAGNVNIDHSATNASTLYHTQVYNGVLNNPGVNRKQFRSVLSADGKILGQTLSAFAAYGNEKLQNNYDSYYLGAQTVSAPDANGVLQNYSFNQQNYYAFQQTKDKQAELRLSSPSSWRLRYTLGYNFTKISGVTTYDYDPTRADGSHVYATPVRILSNTNTVLGNPSKTNGVFGGLYFDVTPQITVSGELRHQWDQISAVTTVQAYSATFQSTLPRFNIQFQPNNHLNFYAVYSVGNNPGGFNTNVPEANLPAGVKVAYGEEKLYNYEGGMKTTWLDGKLTFNIAAYHMDWKNEQVLQSYLTNYPSIGAVSALYSNAAASYVNGFEAELNAQVTRALVLRATASYGKAKYKTYCSSNYYALTGVATGLGCRSVAGKQQEGTPATQISLFADYSHALNETTTGYIRADYQYQSKIFLDEWNSAWIGAANLAGVRIGIQTKHLGFELFVRNLFDDDHSARVTRASFVAVGGSACSVAASAAKTCAAGNYPAVVTAYGTTTAGAAGYQDIADTARRPRQFGLRGTLTF